jgi:hypothetical protein
MFVGSVSLLQIQLRNSSLKTRYSPSQVLQDLNLNLPPVEQLLGGMFFKGMPCTLRS